MLMILIGYHAGLGRHMNMENFITRFTRHEHEHRVAILHVLGLEKAKIFFDKVVRIAPDVPEHR